MCNSPPRRKKKKRAERRRFAKRSEEKNTCRFWGGKDWRSTHRVLVPRSKAQASKLARARSSCISNIRQHSRGQPSFFIWQRRLRDRRLDSVFLTQAFPAVAGRSASLSYVGRHYRLGGLGFGFRPSATNSGQSRITHHQLRNFLSAARALTIHLSAPDGRRVLPPHRHDRSRHTREHTAPRVTTIS